MPILTLTPGQLCQYEGCTAPATCVAVGRDNTRRKKGHPKIAFYCEIHRECIADEGSPEYTASCPNCGCMFGIG